MDSFEWSSQSIEINPTNDKEVLSDFIYALNSFSVLHEYQFGKCIKVAIVPSGSDGDWRDSAEYCRPKNLLNHLLEWENSVKIIIYAQPIFAFVITEVLDGFLDKQRKIRKEHNQS